MKWTREELKQVGQRTEIWLYKALHLRDDIDGLHVLRKELGIALVSMDISLIHQ